MGRAADHLNALKDQVGSWRKRDVYALVSHVNPQNTVFSFTLNILNEPPLQDWSLIIGDCISNLRCALDHLIYAIAVHESNTSPPPNEDALMFPICDGPTAFGKKGVQDRIKTLSLPVRTAIEAMQPYKRPHPSLPPLLSILRDFDNTNKHKLLRLAFATVGQGEFNISVDPIPGAKRNFHTRIRYAEMKQDTEVFSVTCDRPTPDMNCKVRIDFMIALWHGKRDASTPPWGDRTEFSPLLRMLGDEVAFVIDTVASSVS